MNQLLSSISYNTRGTIVYSRVDPRGQPGGGAASGSVLTLHGNGAVSGPVPTLHGNGAAGPALTLKTSGMGTCALPTADP